MSQMYKNLDISLDANHEHVSELLKGVNSWNSWRQKNPDIRPNIRGIDFTDEKALSHTELWKSGQSTEIKIKSKYVVLTGADFSNCLMRGTKFDNADLIDCNFSGAELIFCSFRNSDPWNCQITLADFGGADLSGADFGSVKYSRRKMRRNFLSIRGADLIIGDAVFKRDVLDQDYLDTLDFRIIREVKSRNFIANLGSGFRTISPIFGFCVGLVSSLLLSLPMYQVGVWFPFLLGIFGALIFGLLGSPYGKRIVFEAWGLFDYGRSWRRVGVFATLSIISFGFVFSLASPEHISFVGQGDDINLSFSLTENWLQPYLFSAAGFVSGGLLGIAAVRSDIGLLLVLANGLVGLSTFALFLSTLTASFARQH